MRVLTLNLGNISEPLEARSSALVAGLKQLRPDIVCFNDAPDLPAIRTILASNLALLDEFASRNPKSEGHTFSARNHYVNAPPEEGGRIDYIFAGGEPVLRNRV